jgi:hypothetical protein
LIREASGRFAGKKTRGFGLGEVCVGRSANTCESGGGGGGRE